MRTQDEDEESSSVFHSVSSTVPLVDLSPKRTGRPQGVGEEGWGEHGLVVMDLTDIKLFAVSGYMGDSTHNYFCAQVGLEVHMCTCMYHA